MAWQNAVAFTNAVFVTSDYDLAGSYASPGGPAERYLAHLRNADAAITASGQAPPAEEPATVTPNREAGSFEIAVPDLDEPYTWSDYVSDEDGLVISWTGAAGPVSDVLWTTDQSSSALGQTLTLVSAYRTNTGDMWIVLDVTPEKGVNPDYGAIYVGPDGVAHAPAFVISPGSLVGGATSKLALIYEASDFGGTLVYSVNSADYSDVAEVRLAIS